LVKADKSKLENVVEDKVNQEYFEFFAKERDALTERRF